jgi:cytochrome c553
MARLAIIASLCIAAVMLAEVPAQKERNVWEGVFTTDQSAQGEEQFLTHCSRCHQADLSGGEHPPLKGPVFLGHWLEDDLTPLFNKMKKMPPSGEKLDEDNYVRILAHILNANSFPPGTEELKVRDLGMIRLTGRNGPGPVPDFALVQTVGCLEQSGEMWTLTNGAEPIRSRNPDKPTDQELEEAKSRSLGSHQFVLMSPSSFKPGFQIVTHRGEKMQAKGLLIRTPKDERLNVTWLETIASTCP